MADSGLVNLGEHEVTAEEVAEAIITSKVLRERLAALGIHVRVDEGAGGADADADAPRGEEEEEEAGAPPAGGGRADVGAPHREGGELVTPPCTVDVHLDARGAAAAARREISPLPDTPPMPEALRALGAHVGGDAAAAGAWERGEQHTPSEKVHAFAPGHTCLLPLPSTPVMANPPTTVKKKKPAAAEEDAARPGSVPARGALPDEPGAPSPFRTPGVSLKKSARKAAFFGDGSTRTAGSPCPSPLGSRMNIAATLSAAGGGGTRHERAGEDDEFAAAEAEAAAFAAGDAHDENGVSGGVARTLVMSAQRQNQVFIKSSSTRKSRFRPPDADVRSSL